MVRIDAEVEEEGTALVPGRLLAEITRSLLPARAEFVSDGDMVGLTCGSAEFSWSRCRWRTTRCCRIRRRRREVEAASWRCQRLSQFAAASRDDTLPMLTAVCLDVRDETLTLAATDRYRLAVKDVRWEPAARGLRAAAMVPARTLADFARSITPGVPVTVAFGAGHRAPAAAARRVRRAIRGPPTA